jgi:glutamine amidotransferase
VITIIDLGISNIKSITRGFITQGFEVKITTRAEDVAEAASLVLPGVGAFPKAVEVLKGRGLWGAIKAHAASGKPLIGICLGMQLLFTDSDEHSLTEGLNLVPGRVRRFPPDRPVPHMGWNEVTIKRDSPLFRGVPDKSAFYFVHSYYGEPDNPVWEVGSSDHGGRFTAAVQRGNVFGTQFHPEKSQDRGLAVLRNFARLTEARIGVTIN